MRNQSLTGYLLHHKPYQEKRALYYFFTHSHGLVHGMGKKGMPLFVPIQLFATGKRTLKSFSQIQPVSLFNESIPNETNSNEAILDEIELTKTKEQSFHNLFVQSNMSKNKFYNQQKNKSRKQITGKNIYAGFYLNELLWKLLEIEDEMPNLWLTYQMCLDCLREVDLDNHELRLLLRKFEMLLFNELGYTIDFQVDNQNKAIISNMFYRFSPDSGFEVILNEDNKFVPSSANQLTTDSLFSGKSLIKIDTYLQEKQSNCFGNVSIDDQTLRDWSRLYKQFIDCLLNHKPLKSRELWKNFAGLN